MTIGRHPPGALFGLTTFVFAFAWGSPTFARLVRPCTPGEPAHVQAERELASIDSAVRSLAPGDYPEELVARIEKLASTKCFETLERVQARALNGLSLKTYWQYGGFARLRSTLRLGGTGKRMFWTEPSIRRALTVETAPRSPIAAILCPAADEACGAETAGWELRAEGLFELAGKVGRPSAASRRHEDDCQAAARTAAAHKRFVVWRDCFEASRDEVTPKVGLPIGRTRAPKQGWLVITGRRGHYDFCDELRAYDLATGSAYVVGSCSSLALEPGGSVNRKRTDDARRPTIAIGHLALDRLREAAWMTLLLDELHRDVRGSVGTEVPTWLEVSVDRHDTNIGSVFAEGFTWSTAQTPLGWVILGNPGLVKGGSLKFPKDPDDVADDQATRLIRIAEASFVAGCPAALPPETVTGRIRRSSDLRDAWAQVLATRAACRGSK